MNKDYAPQLCIAWAQADLGALMVAFHKQMSENSSDYVRLLELSLKLKKKAAEIEAECLRRIE